MRGCGFPSLCPLLGASTSACAGARAGACAVIGVTTRLEHLPHLGRERRVAGQQRLQHARQLGLVAAWGARSQRCVYGTPEAGARTQCVPCVGPYVGPWAQAALRLLYVHNAGGRYA